MKKTLKIAAFVLSGLVIAGASGAAIYKAQTEANSTIVAVAVISQGSKGETVKLIQQKLKRWGYYKGTVDGVFGAATKAAVKYFQSKNGLKADGVVGAKTLAALGITDGSSAGGKSNGSSSYSNSDVTLLARLIYGEARGESYSGQVAVGAVVMNRVKSSSFPNTISGVIYQPYAFTAVADGQINLSPDSRALSAAKEALNGYDPTYGALYYYNPSTATSTWIFLRKTTITIGNHVFAR